MWYIVYSIQQRAERGSAPRGAPRKANRLAEGRSEDRRLLLLRPVEILVAKVTVDRRADAPPREGRVEGNAGGRDHAGLVRENGKRRAADRRHNGPRSLEGGKGCQRIAQDQTTVVLTQTTTTAALFSPQHICLISSLHGGILYTSYSMVCVGSHIPT